MDAIIPQNTKEQNNTITTLSTQIITEAAAMPDLVLRRLMEEVKNDNVNSMFAYDRAHNRHNRGR